MQTPEKWWELFEKSRGEAEGVCLSFVTLKEFEEAVHYAGACWMLRSIRASLQGYPNQGGDIEIMKEVDRLIAEARNEA